jgi:hypothetical protein
LENIPPLEDRDPAREDDQVGLARGGAQRLGAEAGEVVARAADDRDRRLDRAAGEAEGEREAGVGAAPVEQLLEVGHHDLLLDEALQLLTLEVAAKHVAGAQLPVPHRLALYLQFSAPFRQT